MSSAGDMMQTLERTIEPLGDHTRPARPQWERRRGVPPTRRCRSLAEAIDTTTPGGRLSYHLFAPSPISNDPSSGSGRERGYRLQGNVVASGMPAMTINVR